MIRVGMLGCAHVHAAGYARHLVSEELGARLVAVWDADRASAEAFAKEFGITVADEPEVLCRGVDAVIVTSEHVRYAAMVYAAAAAGLPVLCEKPLGTSTEEGAALLGSGAWLSVAFPVRYTHQVRAAREEIASGRLGSLLAMSGVNHGSFPGRFFGTRSLSGGGAIIDHVVHIADALRFLTHCEYDTVYSEAERFWEVGDVEDCAQVVATTTDGAWASIDPSWSRPRGMAGANDFVMTLWFERGRVLIDGFARHGTLVGEGGAVAHRGYGASMDSLMLADWVAAVTEGRPPPVSALDGWKATEVALAAAASSKSGEVVTLPIAGAPTAR
ncbi:MAG: Gfo/Idh/MocA family protein [Acidimicrobiales bacterium]